MMMDPLPKIEPKNLALVHISWPVHASPSVGNATRVVNKRSSLFNNTISSALKMKPKMTDRNQTGIPIKEFLEEITRQEQEKSNKPKFNYKPPMSSYVPKTRFEILFDGLERLRQEMLASLPAHGGPIQFKKTESAIKLIEEFVDDYDELQATKDHLMTTIYSWSKKYLEGRTTERPFYKTMLQSLASKMYPGEEKVKEVASVVYLSPPYCPSPKATDDELESEYRKHGKKDKKKKKDKKQKSVNLAGKKIEAPAPKKIESEMSLEPEEYDSYDPEDMGFIQDENGIYHLPQEMITFDDILFNLTPAEVELYKVEIMKIDEMIANGEFEAFVEQVRKEKREAAKAAVKKKQQQRRKALDLEVAEFARKLKEIDETPISELDNLPLPKVLPGEPLVVYDKQFGLHLPLIRGVCPDCAANMKIAKKQAKYSKARL